MTVLQDWWEDLRAHVIPPDASEKQVRDMRIAFLIGVRESLAFIFEHQGTPESDRSMKELAEEVTRGLTEILVSLKG